MGEVATGLGLIPLLRCEETKSGLLREPEAANEIRSGNASVHNSDDVDCCDSNNSLIQITTSSASPVVVIGRCQLLDSFRAAYNNVSDESESSYREALQWGTKHLSREMLRFSAAGMQIRAKHGAIRNILGISSIPNGRQDTNHDSAGKQIAGETQKDSEWSTNSVKVKPGTTLSFGTPAVQGLLTFRVVRTKRAANTITTNNRLVERTNEQNPPDKTPPPSIIDLTDEEEAQEERRVEAIRPSLAGQDAVGKSPTNPLKTDSTDREIQSPFVVYFFPFGNGFSASRRQKLEHNMKQLGATIADDLWKAQYVVISESVRSLATVATRLRVDEARLVRHFHNNPNIRCIQPSWADHCIASTKSLVVPSRIHYWCHTPPSPTIANKKSAGKRKRDEIGKQGQGKKNQKQTVSVSADDGIQMRRKAFPRNVQVAEAFKTLADLHQSMHLLATDSWKSYCFRIVAGRLLELDFEVSDDEETQQRLRSIKGFGKSVCEKIQECIHTGTISRIQEFRTDPQRVAMKSLMDIWGVGPVRASDLMERGYRTIDDVRQGICQRRLVLERNQLVGVDCYEDILDEMTRSEVEAIGEKVRQAAERLFPGIETSIMGSYRRGKKSCGDADIQLTHPDFVTKIPTDALSRIIDMLWSEGNIAMHLTSLNGMTTGLRCIDYQKASRHVPMHAWEKAKSPSKQTEYKFYMGCFNSPVHPNRRRRVDIKFYPYRERAFATLYFTGNGYFNRSMRLWATRAFGFKLSDQGMFARGDGKTRVFEASTEREIFDRLKLVYREPHERQYWDALEPMDDAMEPDFRMTEAQWNHDKKSNQWVK